MTPLIAPDYWMNSQLSVARYYGGCNIQGIYYYIHRENDYLIRADLRIYVEKLGFNTVKKAVMRHKDVNEAREVLKRLTRIIKTRKRAEKNREPKLFEQ